MTDPSLRNPYPGLRPFGAAESHLFFGRDDEVDAMIDRLAARRLLAVLGGSGSGKSSLVNCGLRPALHTGLLARAGTAWRVAACRPGGDPIGALARALAEPGVLFDDVALPGADGLAPDQLIETALRMSRRGLIDVVEMARLPGDVNVLVVVDQFEELFRYRRLGGHAAADDAATFVGLLLQARAQRELPIFLVLTMRSDFLGECSAYEGLAQAISDGQYLVPRMTREERRAAITGPAGVAGARIEPVLLTRLVNDVGDDPDQLSILQHALNRTWVHWAAVDGRGPLTLRHYEDPSVGTMTLALDRHAEQAWQALPDEASRLLAERLLRALTDCATDPRGVRRPARLATLCAITQSSPDALRAIIDVLRDPDHAFLMPPWPEPIDDDTVVDIAHESLMRVWRRLRSWADDEARSAQQLRRLADAAALQAKGRSGLWRDPELHFALAWEAQARPNAAWARQYGVDLAPALAFLRGSEAARDAEARDATRRQSLRRWALGAFVLGLMVVGAVFLGLWQRTESLLVVTESRRMVLQGQGLLAGDVATPIDVALLLGAGAFQLDRSNEAYGGLKVMLDQTARLQRALPLPGPVIAIGPGGTLIATVQDQAVQLRDAATGAARGAPLLGHAGPVNAVAISADGATVATAGDDSTVRLWDAATGASRGAALRGHRNRVWSVAFSADGRLLASGDEDGTLRLWDVASGDARGSAEGHALRVFALAFSPLGELLASAGDDGAVRLWRTAPLAARGPALTGHRGGVSALAFSADGSRLASAGADREIRRWDVASGQPFGAPMVGHGNRIWSLDFSPDGRQLASAGEDQSVRLWDLDSGRQLGAALLGHKSRVWRVAYQSDGAGLVSGGNDRMLLRWRSDDGSADMLRAPGPPRPLRAVAISRDGRLIAAAGDDGEVRLWDAETRRESGAPLHGHAGSVSGVAFSPDGRLLASAGEDGTLRLWDIASRQPIGAPMIDAGASPSGPAWSLDFSPDGRRLASGHADGRLRLWDVASGRGLGAPLDGHAGHIWDLAFSPDGTLLATAGEDATVRLWEVDAGRARGGALAGHVQRVWSVAFSPDGRQLASGGEDGSIRLWDAGSGVALGPPLFGHLQAVTAVAFSPDGRVLASASDDATLRYWDIVRRELRGSPLVGHRAAVGAIAFAADGRMLVSASDDGSVRLWDTPPVWIDRVCAKLTRNLSAEEWQRLVGSVDYMPQCPPVPMPGDGGTGRNKR